MRLQENGEVWVSWFVGYFIRIISSLGYHPKYSERWGVLCRSISRYFIRFLEKDSSRKLIFFLIFGRRFLEKDDFQQDPLLFETRPTPSCKKILKIFSSKMAS